MKKRDRSPPSTSTEDRKSKKKRSKKNAKTESLDATDFLDEVFDDVNVRRPAWGTGDVPKVKIKKEDEDGGDNDHVVQEQKDDHDQKLGKSSKADKSKGKGKAKLKDKTGQGALQDGDTVDEGGVDAKPKRDRKAKKKSPSVTHDSNSDNDESNVESSDGDSDESSDGQKSDSGDNQHECSSALAVAPPSAEIPMFTNTNTSMLSSSDSRVSTMRSGCIEAEWYLSALINLPLTSPVFGPSLRGMVYQWLNNGYTLNAIREACHNPTISQQLLVRGATPQRLTELSEVLQQADLLEFAARWFEQRFDDADMRRSICSLILPPPANQRNASREPVLASSSRVSQSQPAAPGFDNQRHGTFRPSSPSMTVPYVRPGDAHKVLLFVVGMPDTPIADVDYNAYEFHSACEKSFGFTYIENVSRWSENTWKVDFRGLHPGFLQKPVHYRNAVLHPEQAFSTAPTCFSSTFTKEVSDSAIIESIAAVFQDRSWTAYRLEQPRKITIIHFHSAPGLIRIHVPMLSKNGFNFTPAFKPFKHRGGACLFCQTLHTEAVCPCARILT